MGAAAAIQLDESSRAFYQDALGSLDREGLEYLVGGAYAFARYTHIERHTKDFDIFIRREDFLRFLTEHGVVCLRAAEYLSQSYHSTHEHVRSLGLSHSASEKMAKLLLEWGERSGKPSDKGLQLKLTLTHEEVAQIIGSSRETVTPWPGTSRPCAPPVGSL